MSDGDDTDGSDGDSDGDDSDGDTMVVNTSMMTYLPTHSDEVM